MPRLCFSHFTQVKIPGVEGDRRNVSKENRPFEGRLKPGPRRLERSMAQNKLMDWHDQLRRLLNAAALCAGGGGHEL